MRHLAIATLLLATLTTACNGNPACASAEENLPKCNVTYYGDDNCELLIEDCTDDDLIILDTLFQCYGDACDAGNANAVIACDDTHFGRLTAACQEAFLP